jgi:hypothetical protein
MPVAPGETFDGAPGAAPGAGIPWDERGRIGLLAALIETTRCVLTAPFAFFRSLPVTGGLGSPLLYGVILGWIGVVAAAFYQALFRSLVGPSVMPFSDRPELVSLLGMMEGWAGFAGQAVFGWVFVVIGIFISTGVFHLMLLLLGGARRGFEATLRVLAFSQATSVVMLLPFCGSLIGVVWTLVLCVIGLAEVHQIGHGKAAAAVLLPIVLLCCCCGAVFGLAFLGAAGLATQLR